MKNDYEKLSKLLYFVFMSENKIEKYWKNSRKDPKSEVQTKKSWNLKSLAIIVIITSLLLILSSASNIQDVSS